MFTYSSDVDLFTCNVSSDSVITVAVDTVSRVSGIEDFNFESLDTNHYDIIGGKGSGNFRSRTDLRSILDSVSDPVLLLLEQPLYPHVHSPPILSTTLPTVPILLKRLRPVMVLDPLLDENGEQYKIIKLAK